MYIEEIVTYCNTMYKYYLDNNITRLSTSDKFNNIVKPLREDTGINIINDTIEEMLIDISDSILFEDTDYIELESIVEIELPSTLSCTGNEDTLTELFKYINSKGYNFNKDNFSPDSDVANGTSYCVELLDYFIDDEDILEYICNHFIMSKKLFNDYSYIRYININCIAFVLNGESYITDIKSGEVLHIPNECVVYLSVTACEQLFYNIKKLDKERLV